MLSDCRLFIQKGGGSGVPGWDIGGLKEHRLVVGAAN